MQSCEFVPYVREPFPAGRTGDFVTLVFQPANESPVPPFITRGNIVQLGQAPAGRFKLRGNKICLKRPP
jgi:hypothetical protein